MSAGAGVMVIGWYTGFKLGKVITFLTADYFEKLGYENYWQITFLLLTILIVACNIGLMFINEKNSLERKVQQQKNDQLILAKLGSSNSFNTKIAWIVGTISGPFISFFKSKGTKIGIYIIVFLFLFKIRMLNPLHFPVQEQRALISVNQWRAISSSHPGVMLSPTHATLINLGATTATGLSSRIASPFR